MATKATEDTSDELRAELNALRSDLAALVDTVKEMGREGADSALHAAKDAVDDAKKRLKMTAAEARERGEAAAADVEALVTRHPIGAIFAALGIGFILGRAGH